MTFVYNSELESLLSLGGAVKSWLNNLSQDAMANGQRLTAAINRGNENSFNQPSKTKLMAVWPFVLVLSQVDDEFSIRRLIAKRYNRWTINELSMRVWTTIVQHQVMYQLMIDGTNVPRNDRWY